MHGPRTPLRHCPSPRRAPRRLMQPIPTSRRSPMPRRIAYTAFWAALLVMLSACQALGVATPQTFNEKLAAGYSTITAARDTAATLLTSGKLSVSDAQNVQV